MSENKLYVSSVEQKIIFYCEMRGQISDGYWENMRPHDHWKIWSSLEWDDIIVSDRLKGRTFDAKYSNYNFAAIELLKIVGERLAYKIRLYKHYPKIMEPILKENHWEIPENLRMLFTMVGGINTPLQPFLEKTRMNLLAKGLTAEMMLSAWIDMWYNVDLLREDCKKLQEACKIKLIKEEIELYG